MNDNLTKCFESNISNPFMNYLPISSETDRNSNCDIDHKELYKNFYKGSMFNPCELRKHDYFFNNFYTQPVTTVVNNQTNFAKTLFPDTAKCRNTGYSCKINTDMSKKQDRTIILPNNKEIEYLNIFGVYK